MRDRDILARPASRLSSNYETNPILPRLVRRPHNAAVQLTWLDWFVVALYFALNVGIGFYYKARAGKVLRVLPLRSQCALVAGQHVDGSYTVCGRHAKATGPVATAVSPGTGSGGIFVFSGMLTAFLSACLWRRSGVMTDIEFSEIRYAGKPAAFLQRGFRALI